MRYAVFFLLIVLLFLPGESWARTRSGVNPEKIDELKAAAPLNHSVRISRAGRVLKLDYKLIGSDGKKYNLWDISDKSKPTVTIYNNNEKVCEDKFEFG